MLTDEEKLKNLTKELTKELNSSNAAVKKEEVGVRTNEKNIRKAPNKGHSRRVGGIPKVQRSSEETTERKVLYIKIILLSIFLYLIFFMINDESRGEKYGGGIERIYTEMANGQPKDSGGDTSIKKEIFEEKHFDKSKIDSTKKEKKDIGLKILDNEEDLVEENTVKEKVHIEESEMTEMVREAERLLEKKSWKMGE